MQWLTQFERSCAGACVLWLILSLAGCQSAANPGFDNAFGAISSQRLVQLQEGSRIPAPHSTAKRSDWSNTGNVPATDGFMLRDVALASFQAQTESPASAKADSRSSRGPLPGFSDTLKRDLRRFPRELWAGTVDVYTDPFNLVVLVGAGGSYIALRQNIDEDNAEFFEENNHFGRGWRDALSFIGSPATHFVVSGLWYGIGVAKQDEKTYEVGRTLIEALTINGLSTMAIKLVSGRDSPNGESLAFPSGHTSSSVTFATVMHEAYGPWVGVPLYGLSALIAIERLDDGEHWVSDVVFGAALGWVVGHTVSSGRAPEIFGGEIAPYANPDTGTTGIAWVKTFD